MVLLIIGVFRYQDFWKSKVKSRGVAHSHNGFTVRHFTVL